MGIILSRVANTGEISWCYLASLFQVEYRRWIYTHILKRGRKHKTSTNSSSDSSTIPATDTVGTQTRVSVAETCTDFTLDDTETEPTPTGRSDSSQIDFTDDTSSCSSFDSLTDDGEEHIKTSGSPVPSEYNDICIFENPDFTQFGQTYRHLASPHDRQLGCGAPRARRMSSLSPVKEELGLCQCEDVESPSPEEVHSDTFLVYEDEKKGKVTDGNGASNPRIKNVGNDSDSRQRLWGISDTPVCDSCKNYEIMSKNKKNLETQNGKVRARGDYEGTCRSRSTYCSFSPDSGISEGLNRSANTSIPDESYPFNNVDKPHHHEYTQRGSHDISMEDSFHNFRHRMSANTENDKTPVESANVAFKDSRNRGRSITDAQKSSVAPNKPKRKVTFLKDNAENRLSPSILYASPASSFEPLATSSDSSSGWRRSGQASSSRQKWSGAVNGSDSSSSLEFSPCSPAAQKHCFAQPGEGRDLVLIAEGERFHVHSSLMTHYCHALRVHLKVTGSREVILEAKRAEDVLNFLYLLYLFGEEVTEETVEGVLDVAQHLGCVTVTGMCEDFLLSLSSLPNLCPHHRTHPHLDTVAQDCGGKAADGSSGGSGDPVNLTRKESHHIQDGNMHAAISAARTNQQPTHLCACADRMANRVVDILQIALKYELHKVYDIYVDVAARLTTADWMLCARYSHLSARTGEDIQQSRIARLENVVTNVTVTRSSLISCHKSRHEHDRVSIKGVVCLRCTSRKIVQEARISV